MTQQQLTRVRVMSTHYEADDILSFVLAPLDGAHLEAFEPGAHIDVHLPNGIMRSYSISNQRTTDGAYRLTIARDVKTTGGSRYMHETVHAGHVLEISPPRNNFPLNEHAPYSVMISGGIGVTPFVPMAARLNELGRAWKLYYCARTASRAALLEELRQLAEAGAGELVTNFDEEPGGKMIDLTQVLGAVPTEADVYCCGPIGMLNAFRSTAETVGIRPERVHFEYFNSDIESAVEGGFTVVLQRSGKEINVQKGQTILHALLDGGVDMPYSCEEGVCGACEAKVIEGEPDHRDLVLTEREKAANKTMMICCSGSKSARLVLDL